MASKRKANGSDRLDKVEAGFARLESVQRDTNTRLGRIEGVLETSSMLFELMHDRLGGLEEGQRALVEGQQALVEGQKLIVDRLDRLVEATPRDRTEQVERIARLEQRVEHLERA